jgi:hypothetical protein
MRGGGKRRLGGAGRVQPWRWAGPGRARRPGRAAAPGAHAVLSCTPRVTACRVRSRSCRARGGGEARARQAAGAAPAAAQQQQQQQQQHWPARQAHLSPRGQLGVQRRRPRTSGSSSTSSSPFFSRPDDLQGRQPVSALGLRAARSAQRRRPRASPAPVPVGLLLLLRRLHVDDRRPRLVAVLLQVLQRDLVLLLLRRLRWLLRAAAVRVRLRAADRLQHVHELGALLGRRCCCVRHRRG